MLLVGLPLLQQLENNRHFYLVTSVAISAGCPALIFFFVYSSMTLVAPAAAFSTFFLIASFSFCTPSFPYFFVRQIKSRCGHRNFLTIDTGNHCDNTSENCCQNELEVHLKLSKLSSQYLASELRRFFSVAEKQKIKQIVCRDMVKRCDIMAYIEIYILMLPAGLRLSSNTTLFDDNLTTPTTILLQDAETIA